MSSSYRHAVVVIPTYNERENIAVLIERLAWLAVPSLSVLVVDDASPDGTAGRVRELMARYPFVSLCERPGKGGLGSAYIKGFTRACDMGADVVCEMDADLSHAPEDLPRLFAALAPEVDVVIGSRRVLGGRIEGWHWRRHVASAGAMWLSRLVLGIRTKDATSGFRVYRRHALEGIDFHTIRSDGYAFQEEILLRCEQKGFRVVEVPVTFVDRVRGSSKLGIREIASFFIMLIRLSRLWRR